MTAIDITSYLGLVAVSLLTLNILIGLSMGVRYNPWKRWPHRRINQLRLHNWTGYVALGTSALHPIPLLLVAKPHFRLVDLLVPLRSPQQPVINSIGAVTLYALVFVVATSYYRAEIGHPLWKKLHYTSYAVAVLFVVHGVLTDQTLKEASVDYLDAEKVYIEVCGVIITVATVLRARWAWRRRPPLFAA